jgi:hypothetical protein
LHSRSNTRREIGGIPTEETFVVAVEYPDDEESGPTYWSVPSSFEREFEKLYEKEDKHAMMKFLTEEGTRIKVPEADYRIYISGI